ncbi:hypothetical protein [Lactococcus garvieae]|uniref:hypothetical protein n=1 Tax=Lactococcus garvieae TaxID=1363 RepID=UPI0037C9608C
MIILILVLTGITTTLVMLFKGYGVGESYKCFFKGMLVYGLVQAIRKPKKELELTDYINFSIVTDKKRAKIAEYEKLGYEVVAFNSLMTGVTMRKIDRDKDNNEGTA